MFSGALPWSERFQFLNSPLSLASASRVGSSFEIFLLPVGLSLIVLEFLGLLSPVALLDELPLPLIDP